MITTKQASYGIRNKDNKINISTVLLLMLYVIVSAAYIPSAVFAGPYITSGYFFMLLAITWSLLGILLCVRIIGSFKPLLPFCILSVLVLFMLGSPIIAAIVPILFTSVCIFACLIKELRSPALVLIFALSYGLAYFMTRSFFFASFVLIIIPIAYTVYFTFKNSNHRVPSVCKISCAAGASLLIYFLVWIYLREGNIGIETLKNFFVSLRGTLSSTFAEALVFASSQIAEGAISPTFATEISEALVSSIFNLLPAVFVIILFIISYVIHSLYLSLMSASELDTENYKNALLFKMSTTSAVLFIVTFLATIILSSDGYNLYATIAQNICIMLEPGFVLIAFAFLSGRTKGQRPSCVGYLLYFGMIMMIFYAPSVVFTIASFIGAVLVIVSAFKQRKNDNNNQNIN